ncbi:erv26 super protein, partial [Dissophora globulifera]
TVVLLHLSLWILDGLPFTKIVFSLGCHAVYSLNLANFPYINLLSVPFLLSCVLVLADHFIWFQFFARHYYSFASIASFFGICVWMVPFVYFISLSANDNALPSFDKSQQDGGNGGSHNKKKNGILKGLFGALLSKKDTPTLVEAPRYTGFGSASLGSSRPSTPVAYASSSSGVGATGTGAGSPYPSFNPDKNQLRPDYPISRPGSSNSNIGGQHGYQGGPVSSSSYGGSQPYASSSSSAVYSHSSSNLGSRF